MPAHQQRGSTGDLLLGGDTVIKAFAALVGFSLLAVTGQAAEPLTKPIEYDNIHIRVLDPPKAADWYVKALGATLDEPPAPGTAQVTFGTNVITITKGDTVVPSM